MLERAREYLMLYLNPDNETSDRIRTEAGYKDLRVCLPAIILKFDATKQRAEVRPAVKMKDTSYEGEVTYPDMAKIFNVPVVMPYGQGAGLLLTIPIQAGDACLLVFSDKYLDEFNKTGTYSRPGASQNEGNTIPRSHSLTDAICIPGYFTAPVAVPDYSTDHIEIRDKNRKMYFSLGADGFEMCDGKAMFTMKDGDISINAPGKLTINTGGHTDITSQNFNLTDTMNLKSGTFIDKNNRDSTAHRHNGVDSGSGTSGSTVV
jgi:hypothetical protein